MVALFGSILLLAFLPWLDTSKVRSAKYRPLYRQFFWVFVARASGLAGSARKPAEGGYVIAARILTAWYFIHFLIVLPLLGLFENAEAVAELDFGMRCCRRAVLRRPRCCRGDDRR